MVDDVNAHGCGKVVIANEHLSGYMITVCHFPFPAETGTNHITVALSDEQTKQPMLNQSVMITATNGTKSIRKAATHDNATNRLLYEADFNIKQAEEWTFEIGVSGVNRPLTFTAVISQATFLSAERIAAGLAVVIVVTIWRRFGRTYPS